MFTGHSLPLSVASAQPPSVTHLNYRSRMESASKKIARENVLQYIQDTAPLKPHERGVTRLQALGLKGATAQRMLADDQDIRLETLDVLAEHMRVQPWQLLVPGFRKGGRLPSGFSEQGSHLASLFDSISDPTERQRSWAICLAALTGFAPVPTPSGSLDPMPTPAHQTNVKIPI